MRNWFKKWLFADNTHLAEDSRPAYEALQSQASIQAFKIDNGYIVRVRGADMYINESRVPNLHFCKDHQEIADYIVAQSAINKLVGEQMELPLTGGTASLTRAHVARY